MHSMLQRENMKAHEISDEIGLQDSLLDRVDGKQQRQNQRIRDTNKRIDKLIKNNKGTCCCWLIIIVELVFLIAMIATNNLTMGFPKATTTNSTPPPQTDPTTSTQTAI